jgi:hypothetical protein
MMKTLLAAAAAIVSIPLAFAQGDYPNHPITMIVPFPPGGVADITGRPVAEAMGRFLKQPVVVENKAGAGGGVGMAYVSKSKPDGYTSCSRSRRSRDSRGRPDPRPRSDVCLRPAHPGFPLHRGSHGARGARRRPLQKREGSCRSGPEAPQTIPYGSSGNYGTMHVPMEMLSQSAGVKLLHVPFTGAGPAIVALLGGQVEAISTGPSTVIGHAKGGKVRILATWGDSRHPGASGRAHIEGARLRRAILAVDRALRPCGNARSRHREAARSRALRRRGSHVKAALAKVETPIQYLDQPQSARSGPPT